MRAGCRSDYTFIDERVCAGNLLLTSWASKAMGLEFGNALHACFTFPTAVEATYGALPLHECI